MNKHQNYEYLLVTGAPGSRWSGVVRDFYYSPDINTSDYKKKNSYTRKGQEKPMHFGEYFGVNQQYSTNRLEWDKPFKKNSKGLKIIKSHDFAYQLPQLKEHKQPMLLVYREPILCFRWWKEAGGWDISYPNYEHYGDDEMMFLNIQNESQELQTFLYYNQSNITECLSTYDICDFIGIDYPEGIYSITDGQRTSQYEEKQIKVYLWFPE